MKAFKIFQNYHQNLELSSVSKSQLPVTVTRSFEWRVVCQCVPQKWEAKKNKSGEIMPFVLQSCSFAFTPNYHKKTGARA
jgi:hypothetical protein